MSSASVSRPGYFAELACIGGIGFALIDPEDQLPRETEVEGLIAQYLGWCGPSVLLVDLGLEQSLRSAAVLFGARLLDRGRHRGVPLPLSSPSSG